MGEPERDENGRFVKNTSAPDDGPNFVDIGMSDAKAKLAVDPGEELTEADVLRKVGLDPQEWAVHELRRRRVETADGERASISVVARRRAVALAETLVDPSAVQEQLDAWVARTEPHRPLLPKAAGRAAQDAMVLVLADWQVGGAAGARGTTDTIARVLGAFDAAADRVAALRASGRNVRTLNLFGLGDIVESCTGFYASQLFSVDMTLRQQITTSWQLVLAGIVKLAPLFEEVVVEGVGGNHGELNRVAGKQQTAPSDNLDLLVFDAVKLAVEGRPELEHVSILQPDNPLFDVVDVCGVPVGLTHGHLFNGGQNPSAKAERWWRGQTFGRTPLAGARLLLSGHYHSFAAAEWSQEGRTWMQAPAMDNGSQWFTDSSGLSAPPGMLSLVVGETCGPRGWDDLKIL